MVILTPWCKDAMIPPISCDYQRYLPQALSKCATTLQYRASLGGKVEAVLRSIYSVR